MRSAVVLALVAALPAADAARLLQNANPSTSTEVQATATQNQLAVNELNVLGQDEKWQAWPAHSWAHTASNVPRGGGPAGPGGSVSATDVASQVQVAAALVSPATVANAVTQAVTATVQNMPSSTSTTTESQEVAAAPAPTVTPTEQANIQSALNQLQADQASIANQVQLQTQAVQNQAQAQQNQPAPVPAPAPAPVITTSTEQEAAQNAVLESSASEQMQAVDDAAAQAAQLQAQITQTQAQIAQLTGAPLASVVAATTGAPVPAPAPAPVTAVSPQAAATLLAAVGFPESVLEIVAPALAPTPVVASPPPPQAVQAVTQAAVQSLTQQVQSLENEQNQDAQVAAQALANAATAQTEVVTNKNSHKHIHPAQTQTSSTTTTTDVNAPAPTWAWTPSDARVNAAAAVKKNWWEVDPNWFKESHPPPPPPNSPPLQLVADLQAEAAVNLAVTKLQHKLQVSKVVQPQSTSSTDTTSTTKKSD